MPGLGGLGLGLAPRGSAWRRERWQGAVGQVRAKLDDLTGGRRAGEDRPEAEGYLRAPELRGERLL